MRLCAGVGGDAQHRDNIGALLTGVGISICDIQRVVVRMPQAGRPIDNPLVLFFVGGGSPKPPLQTGALLLEQGDFIGQGHGVPGDNDRRLILTLRMGKAHLREVGHAPLRAALCPALGVFERAFQAGLRQVARAGIAAAALMDDRYHDPQVIAVRHRLQDILTDRQRL